MLRPHDHACLLYETDEERAAGLRLFLREAREAGAAVLYVGDDERAARLLAPAGGRVLAPGSVDPERLEAALREEARRAADEGSAALWVVFETEGSLRHERALERFAAEADAVALCLCDRRRYTGESLLGVTALHSVRLADAAGDATFARELEIETADGTGAIRVSGIVDISNVNRLSKAVDEVVRSGLDLTVDLSGLTFIDVAGLWVFYDAARRLQPQGRKVVLASAPAPVAKVLQILGWHELDALRVVPRR